MKFWWLVLWENKNNISSLKFKVTEEILDVTKLKTNTMFQVFWMPKEYLLQTHCLYIYIKNKNSFQRFIYLKFWSASI